MSVEVRKYSQTCQ